MKKYLILLAIVFLCLFSTDTSYATIEEDFLEKPNLISVGYDESKKNMKFLETCQI